MYTVVIRGLEFYAHHGVSDEEQAIGHRYKVDLDLEVDGTADETDDVAGTVDYGAAAQKAIAIAQGRQHRTVEKLAKTIADGLLQEFASIQSLTVTVIKRLPPAPVIAEEAGV